MGKSYARELVRTGASTQEINEWIKAGGHTNYSGDGWNTTGEQFRRDRIAEEQALFAGVEVVARDGEWLIGYRDGRAILTDMYGDIIEPKDGACFQGEDGQNYRLDGTGKWVKCD